MKKTGSIASAIAGVASVFTRSGQASAQDLTAPALGSSLPYAVRFYNPGMAVITPEACARTDIVSICRPTPKTCAPQIDPCDVAAAAALTCRDSTSGTATSPKLARRRRCQS